MPATTVVAYGTLLTSGSQTYKISQSRDITGPSLSRTSVDVSNVAGDSAVIDGKTVGFKEFKPGMIDAGEISCDLVIDPDQDQIDGTATTGDHPILFQNETWTIEWPPQVATNTGATFACDGFLTQYDVNAPFDGELTASITIKLSGAPTFTDGT